MADFNQAIKWLREGKEIRRNSWLMNESSIFTGTTDLIYYGNDEKNEHFSMTMSDIEATDWEIYCKEHEWVVSGYSNAPNDEHFRTHCKNCDIEKPKDELKTLKDFLCKIPHACCSEFTKRELKQEAIKDIKYFESGEAWTDFAADERKGQENIIEYIKWKNNITDEDLK